MSMDMEKPTASAWAVCKVQNGELSVVYRSLGHTRKEAIDAACYVLGDPPYIAAEIRALGYKAERVRVILE